MQRTSSASSRRRLQKPGRVPVLRSSTAEGGQLGDTAEFNSALQSTEWTTAQNVLSSAPVFMPKKNMTTTATPASLGYSMPAEWAPHEATWLGWPHNPTDWPDKLDTIRWVYG